ncbi:MAG: WD40 repeat domain-containing protein [Thermoplasmata archaeon]|nr:MAG: WD40 repeat domain-containing protein [Thermoplasmata archaeon]
MKNRYPKQGEETQPGAVLLCAVYVLFITAAFSNAQVSGQQDAFNPATLQKVWEYTKEDSEATFWKLAWSPDGSMIAATFFDNKCLVLNASHGTVITELDFEAEGRGTRCDGYAPEGTNPLRACTFSPNGRFLAVGGDDMEVIVLDTSTWEDIYVLTGHKGSIQCLDFSPDSRYLASGSGQDKVIPQNAGENVTRIWDMSNGSEVLVLEGHRDGVLGTAWSHSGNRIATVSDDRTVRIWSFPAGALLQNMTGHTSGVLDVDWSGDDTKLITGSRDYKIKVWDTETGSLMNTWGDKNCVRSVDFHPTAEIAATSGVDLTLKIRDMNTGTSLKVIKDGVAQTAMVMSSRWSPDGTALASGLGKSHTVIMYRFGMGTGEEEEGENVGLTTTVVLIIISIVFILVLYYPVVKKIRGRRG